MTVTLTLIFGFFSIKNSVTLIIRLRYVHDKTYLNRIFRNFGNHCLTNRSHFYCSRFGANRHL